MHTAPVTAKGTARASELIISASTKPVCLGGLLNSRSKQNAAKLFHEKRSRAGIQRDVSRSKGKKTIHKLTFSPELLLQQKTPFKLNSAEIKELGDRHRQSPSPKQGSGSPASPGLGAEGPGVAPGAPSPKTTGERGGEQRAEPGGVLPGGGKEEEEEEEEECGEGPGAGGTHPATRCPRCRPWGRRGDGCPLRAGAAPRSAASARRRGGGEAGEEGGGGGGEGGRAELAAPPRSPRAQPGRRAPPARSARDAPGGGEGARGGQVQPGWGPAEPSEQG